MIVHLEPVVHRLGTISPSRTTGMHSTRDDVLDGLSSLVLCCDVVLDGLSSLVLCCDTCCSRWTIIPSVCAVIPVVLDGLSSLVLCCDTCCSRWTIIPSAVL